MGTTLAADSLDASPAVRRRIALQAAVYGTIVAWLVTTLGFLGDGARMLGWVLGPVAAIASLVLVLRGAGSERRCFGALVAVAVVSGALGLAATRNPWHLTVATGSMSFIIPLGGGAILLASLGLHRLLSHRRWLSVLAGLFVALTASALASVLVVLGIFLFIAAAPWRPSDERVSPDGSFSVEVRPTFEPEVNDIYVRSGSGPLQRERRIGSSGTYEQLPGLTIESSGRVTYTLSCVRSVTVDATTLEVIGDSYEPLGARRAPSGWC